MITVKTRWKCPCDTEHRTSKAVFVHPKLGELQLPWWPSDVERSSLGLDYTEFERPGRTPLLVATAKQLDEYNVGFTVRDNDTDLSVGQWLDTLRDMADSKKPIGLVLAEASRGLFHITALTITEIEHTRAGRPSVADVSMTLKRASDYSVKVGPVLVGKGNGFAIKRKKR